MAVAPDLHAQQYQQSTARRQFGSVRQLPADAWPAAPDQSEYRRVRTSNVGTLLIGGTPDVSTPPQVATKELLTFLPNGHQVVRAGFADPLSFWTEQPASSRS
jgi:hypothetical protein